MKQVTKSTHTDTFYVSGIGELDRNSLCKGALKITLLLMLSLLCGVSSYADSYSPNVPAARKALKAMYHEIIADCKRNTDGERMRKKYLTEDFKDFYDRAIQIDERLYPGEVGEFNGCNLLTQSQDYGTENDITILDLTCERGGLDASGFYYVAHIKLWGNTISLILMAGDNGRFYIDDINGWKYDMKLYVVRNLE